MTDNMELWNQVCETDPAITKKVDTRGGFTAICAQSQKKRATELWGPYGTTWGLGDLTYGTVVNGKGDVLEMQLQATFEYPGGKFPIASDISFKPGNDSLKKLRTDCITKALSDLGFNSDVFEGKFDDNKYVQELEKKYAKPDAKPPAKLAVNMVRFRDAWDNWIKINKLDTVKKALAKLTSTHIVSDEAQAFIVEQFEGYGK